MPSTKVMQQCDECRQSVICGKKEQISEITELIADYSFLSVLCKHFKGEEKPLELPAFLRNRKRA